MDATAMTVVGQLITDARSRFGADAVVAIDVDPALLDEAMEHVLSLGGSVALDHCVVDGVEIRELPDDVDMPRAWTRGATEPQPLTAPDQPPSADG